MVNSMPTGEYYVVIINPSDSANNLKEVNVYLVLGTNEVLAQFKN